jgi:hypothetical protein
MKDNAMAKGKDNAMANRNDNTMAKEIYDSSNQSHCVQNITVSRLHDRFYHRRSSKHEPCYFLI